MKIFLRDDEPRPRVLGTGLVALDIVLPTNPGNPARFWAGGTCGNILIILAYLGWSAAPISRLKLGNASDCLLSDLALWGVSTKLVSVSDKGSTPVIIQKITQKGTNTPRHTFSWRCPCCGAHLPGYKPVTAQSAMEIAATQISRPPDVFFFDRASRGSLVLAEACAKLGAVVVFEPSSVRDLRLFREAWELATVVKYSRDRLKGLPLVEGSNVPMEVETLGAEGLRYRTRLPNCPNNDWQWSPAIKSEVVRDTAGAGDWCTAGLIHTLASRGKVGLFGARAEDIREAIQFGQALASWNCSFEGARGGMYSLTRSQFSSNIECLLSGETACGVGSDESLRLSKNSPLVQCMALH